LLAVSMQLMLLINLANLTLGVKDTLDTLVWRCMIFQNLLRRTLRTVFSPMFLQTVTLLFSTHPLEYSKLNPNVDQAVEEPWLRLLVQDSLNLTNFVCVSLMELFQERYLVHSIKNQDLLSAELQSSKNSKEKDQVFKCLVTASSL
jgi:hypothetical protein